MSSEITPTTAREPSFLQLWLQHPERARSRNLFFKIHLWSGAALGVYVLLMSVTGSLLVFRNHLPSSHAVVWLAKLHTNLLAGETGRFVNGVASAFLTIICITGIIVWWPGVKNWRRGLSVNWTARLPRLNWDVHSALGFWAFGFVLVWAVSGFYFSFPGLFNRASAWFDPADLHADQYLAVLASLHFGRFNWLTEVIWALAGLVPSLLVVTGTFLCCRRALDWFSVRRPLGNLRWRIRSYAARWLNPAKTTGKNRTTSPYVAAGPR
jgi:uncharacterized iron-regulated membrane protein